MSGETKCMPGCTGINLGDGHHSGCGCPDGRLASGQPFPPGFQCDCPQHPVSLAEAEQLLAFYEGSEAAPLGMAHPQVVINSEDFATILRAVRAALRRARGEEG